MQIEEPTADVAFGSGSHVMAAIMGSPPRNGEASELFEQSEASKQTNSKNDLNDISTAAQRARILEALRNGPVTTIGARRDLAVMHPGMRICELRKRGHHIEMIWSREPDELGVLHRQGKYFLLTKTGGA